jgi:adenosylhomocysteine nucleosidase
MTRVGFVTGLAVEARVLRGSLGAEQGAAVLVACAGADARRAKAAAEALIEAGAAALVSYGIAGGLDPGLAAGAVVLPEAVLTPGGPALATARAWRESLHERAGGAGAGPADARLEDARLAGGTLLGSDRAVAAVAEKQGLFEAWGAIAVDMESHAVALAAQSAGLPFLALRAVADPAGRPLPRAVQGSIAPDGRPRAALVTARLMLRPWEIAEVGRLRRDARTALRALGAVTRTLGPGLTHYRGDV